MKFVKSIKMNMALGVWSIFRLCGMGPLLLRIHPKSALLSLGWFRSFRNKMSVDKDMNPIPWWTYSAIAFLKDRLNPRMKVLEFGSGSSTLWLCRHVSEVISVEKNISWAQYIQERLPKNGNLFITDSFEDFINSYVTNIKFDLVVIDVGNRINIAKKIFPMLSNEGVILWDNTDGPDWLQIKSLLYSHNFLEISFEGMTAQEIALSRTTIFYRKNNNCLGI